MVRMRRIDLLARGASRRRASSSFRISGDSGMALAERSNDAAALADERRVVVASRWSAAGRTGAARSANDFSRSGSGSMKMWTWLKAGHQLRHAAMSSAPLPNTSPDMSPTPAIVNGSFWMSVPEVAEVVLHALPGAARGDAHLLVVVAGAAAGGERVAQPEAVLRRRRCWRCRSRWAVPLSAATTRYGSSPS